MLHNHIRMRMYVEKTFSSNRCMNSYSNKFISFITFFFNTGSCNGWGGSHYVTFDGQNYNIQENCSYILVQEITPQYNNFKVIIDYHDCGSVGSSFCPQSLTIYYKSYKVVLTQMLTTSGVVNAVMTF